MRLQQYTGCEWNVKTKTYLHSSLNYGNLPFLIKLFFSNHFTIKNKFRKVTSHFSSYFVPWLGIRACTGDRFVSKVPRDTGQLQLQYTGDVFDTRFVSESVNWTCFEHDFSFLLASIIFVDLHIFNFWKLVYRVTDGMTNSCSAARGSPD